MVIMDIGATFSEALAHFNAGHPTQARALCRRIITEQPGFGGGHYLLGLIELQAGRARKALPPLRTAVDLSPNAPAPRLALARALASTGQAEAASEAYQWALALGPNADAESELADLLRLDGHLEEALLHYRAALALMPERPETLNGLGAALTESGRAEEGEPLLARALEFRPGWPSALNNHGVALLALRRTGEAALCFAQAADAKPDFAAAYRNLADALHLLGRLDDAEAAAHTALRLDSKDARAWLALALVQKAKGEAAKDSLEQAVRRDGRLAQAHFLLGEEALAAEDNAAAERHFRQALENDPRDQFGAQLQLAVIRGGVAPSRAPDAYVRRLFDQYSERFDQSLVGDLGYHGPALLRQAAEEVMGPAGGWAVLDVGCGTGLVGAEFRPLAARLDGIDLSPRMVDKAAERDIYDDLAVGDLVTAMQARPNRYDLIVAGDVFVYLGDLTPAFFTAARALKPGGALVFSVERTETGIILGRSLRYAHDRESLVATAAMVGLRPVLLRADSTRNERGQPVPGWICVMRR